MHEYDANTNAKILLAAMNAQAARKSSSTSKLTLLNTLSFMSKFVKIKSTKITLHVKSPTFMGAKWKCFTVDWVEK